MKKTGKIIIYLIVIEIILFSIIYCYDFFWGNNDGEIKNVLFKQITARISIFLLFVYLLTKLAQNDNKIVSIVSINIFSGLIILLFFELTSGLALILTKNKDSLPSHILILKNPKFQPPNNKKYYLDNNNNYGRWRNPNGRLEIIRCSDKKNIIYTSNSFGARDKERTVSGKNRVVFLGDSFIEGILVEEKNRLSNLLETKTGIEFLNFGIIGANPVQYYTIYNSLVSNKIEHDKIIIGIFSGNDFDSDSNISKSKQLEYPNYRPYWEKVNNKYQLRFTLKNYNESIESQNASENKNVVYETRKNLYHSLSFLEKAKVEIQTNSYFFSIIQLFIEKKERKNLNNLFNKLYEFPNNFTPPIDFTYSLQKIIDENKDKKILFLLIPAKEQILNYKINKINKLTEYFNRNISKSNTTLIDLLPYFANQPNIEKFFIECDGHWNDEGNLFVSELLLKNDSFLNFISSEK
jgi:hypothetical protein